MAPAWKTVMLSEFAAGSSSAAAAWRHAPPGRLVDREERLLHRRTGTAAATRCRRRARPAARSSAVRTISPTVVMISSVRRSKASASAPPHSPKTTSGTSPKRPVSPTYARAGLRVDLGGHRDDGQLGAEDGDDVGQPEPAEVRRRAGAGVGEAAACTADIRRVGLGRRRWALVGAGHPLGLATSRVKPARRPG